MSAGLGLGLYPRNRRGGAGVDLDQLSDGAGTPVTITEFNGVTEAIPAYQCFQRGRANVTLGGSYDVTGGNPTGMVWRVGNGPWVQFSAETINPMLKTWTGTLNIPHFYLAQGALQVRPYNGQSVTPASVADITVTDIILFGGQSGMAGATEKQTVSLSNFNWHNKPLGGAWRNETTDNWTNSALGSFAPAFAAAQDAAGIPPATHAAQHASGTSFAGGHWNPGDTEYEQFKSRVQAEIVRTGGYAAVHFPFGENDATLGTTSAQWQAYVTAMIDDLITNVPLLAGTPIMWPVLGETSGISADEIRDGVVAMAASDARIYSGPSFNHMDYADNLHAGVVDVGQGFTSGVATAQLNGQGQQYSRFSRQETARQPYVVTAAITGASSNQIAVTFDRNLENHTAATGWSLSDEGGAAISSAAQGASANIVVLTCDQTLYGDVDLSFGSDNNAIGATLQEATAVAGVKLRPEFTLDFDAGEGPGALPVNTELPTISGTETVGEELTGEDGEYSGVPAPTVGSYQWQRSDDGSTGWSDISSATSADYTSVAADEDKYVRRSEVATNAVGSAPRVYSAASGQIAGVPSLSVTHEWATDGTPNISIGSGGAFSPTFGALNSNQGSYPSGTNAISLSDLDDGSRPLIRLVGAANNINNGVNRVTFLTQAVDTGVDRWVMARFLNYSQAPLAYINITDDATPDASRVGITIGVTNAVVTKLTGGWFSFSGDFDVAGADLNGLLGLYMTDQNNSTTIVADGTKETRFMDVRVSS